MDIARVADFISKQNPHVVVLQEVDQGTQRSGGAKQADELAKLLGWKVFFGKAIDFQGGQYGQAILSPMPLENTRVIRLSEEGEARIAVVAELMHRGERLTVAGVHLDVGGGERRLREAKVLLGDLAKIKGRCVIAGDWNEKPDAAVGDFLRASGYAMQPKNGAVETCPEDHPKVEIDHFWARGFGEPGQAVVLEDSKASDHRAVICQFGK
jgi:endonuclease/exonuclease/phosphatase family metal-dependent hydrolase